MKKIIIFTFLFIYYSEGIKEIFSDPISIFPNGNQVTLNFSCPLLSIINYTITNNFGSEIIIGSTIQNISNIIIIENNLNYNHHYLINYSCDINGKNLNGTKSWYQSDNGGRTLILTLKFEKCLKDNDIIYLLCYFKNLFNIDNERIRNPEGLTCQSNLNNNKCYNENKLDYYFIFTTDFKSFSDKLHEKVEEYLIRQDLKINNNILFVMRLIDYSYYVLSLYDMISPIKYELKQYISENFIELELYFNEGSGFSSYFFEKTINNNNYFKQNEDFKPFLKNSKIIYRFNNLLEDTDYNINLIMLDNEYLNSKTKKIYFKTLNSKILSDSIFIDHYKSWVKIRIKCITNCKILLGIDKIYNFPPNDIQFDDGKNGYNSSMLYFNSKLLNETDIYHYKINNLDQNANYKLWIRGIRTYDNAKTALYEYKWTTEDNNDSLPILISNDPIINIIDNSINFNLGIANCNGNIYVALELLVNFNEIIPSFEQLSWNRNSLNKRFIDFDKKFCIKNSSCDFNLTLKENSNQYFIYFAASNARNGSDSQNTEVFSKKIKYFGNESNFEKTLIFNKKVFFLIISYIIFELLR